MNKLLLTVVFCASALTASQDDHPQAPQAPRPNRVLPANPSLPRSLTQSAAAGVVLLQQRFNQLQQRTDARSTSTISLFSPASSSASQGSFTSVQQVSREPRNDNIN